MNGYTDRAKQDVSRLDSPHRQIVEAIIGLTLEIEKLNNNLTDALKGKC
jgi:hypothetical protein